MSTRVNEDHRIPGHAGRRAQGTATRASLVEAARALFGDRGYADTSLDEIVSAAAVTKGAEFLEPDPWTALVVGSNLWIDAHLDPAVQRIALRDARAVLGWEAVRDVEGRYGAVLLRGVLRRATRTGVIDVQPLRPLALMIMGALSEACLFVADADDPVAARLEVGGLVDRLLMGMRASPGSIQPSAPPTSRDWS